MSVIEFCNRRTASTGGTNTFLKTVSAFANYDGGEIIFGVDDNGEVTGIQDPEQACLTIENKINDCIHPQPDYRISINRRQGTVTLKISEGLNKPYTYKAKAYRRNDTVTIEVDEQELFRLVLQGKNLNYEQLKADHQDLTFQCLKKKLMEVTGIEVFNKDILKTLSLYSDKNGYNHAAELLSDHNSFPGIDTVRFGESINIIRKRTTLEHECILHEMDQSLEIFQDYYQFEEIHGKKRSRVELIPESAYREAIANALIHRVWDVETQIRIFMFDDRIEITSPGGLPAGISKQEYLDGTVSVLRNPIIGSVFYRLGLVEILGTGVRRIRNMYRDSERKPEFDIYDNSIRVILPVIGKSQLTEDEKLIFNVLDNDRPESMSEIAAQVPFGRSKINGILKELQKKQYIRVQGNGRGTRYLK